MKKNKKSISSIIFFCFIIFSLVLLLFLWVFQILCINTYYRYSRKKDLEKSLSFLIKNYEEDNYLEILNDVAINNDICIEFIKKGEVIYNSSSVDKKCLNRNNTGVVEFENSFIVSDQDVSRVEIVNPAYNNKTLIIGQKFDNETFLFLNTSLVPLDGSIKLLKKQFIYIVFASLFLSSLASYIIAKKLSIPIIKINNNAKKIGNKDYDISYNNESDILEIDELNKTLVITSRELSKTDELRRELMANVSHDLKTPLTLIRAYAEAARDIDSEKKEKRENDLNVIVGETERLTLLVNDILELSKLESNIIELNYEDINLFQLINSIVKKFEILKQDNFKFKINCKKNIIVNSDRKRLEQVIYNLVNNAINFTGDDKKVIINVIEINNEIKVEVIDTGIGISSENLPLIWDKYYKVNKQRKRNKYGTGLGLSIVKSILVNLNYEYGVNSVVNEGTTFYFIIK